MDVKVKCEHCGKSIMKYVGHVNRTRKLGGRLFCDRKCFGLFWRSNKTKEEKAAEKAAYDVKYRQNNLDWKMFQAAFQFTWDYQNNPEKYREWRSKRMPKHVEYCRQKSYRKYKKKYDLKYYANKKYGEYGEAAVILYEIESIIDKRLSRQDRNCHNKTQKRKRLWKNLQRSTSKMHSGEPSKTSKRVKSNTRTRMLLPAKRGKSSGRLIPK